MPTFPHDSDLLSDAVLRATPGRIFVMRRLFRLLIIFAQEFYFVTRVAALYSLDCLSTRSSADSTFGTKATMTDNFEAVVIVIFAQIYVSVPPFPNFYPS